MLNARLKLREDEADGVVSKEARAAPSTSIWALSLTRFPHIQSGSQVQSYDRRVDFANAFNKLKRTPPQVRVSVAVQEQVDVVLDPGRTMSRTTSNGAYTPASNDSTDLDHKHPDFMP